MRKFWRLISLILSVLILIGIILGISKAFKNIKNKKDESIKNIFSKVQIKQAEVVKLFTYGTSLNLKCKISGINKDNYESSRIIISDGLGFEKEYKLTTDFDENELILTSNYINDGIKLEELKEGKYYIMIRLKLNNSNNHKYYLIKNSSEHENLEYYTITQKEKNKKINLEQIEYEYNKKHYSYLKLNIENTKLPENIYDIVIDAGHGGDDKGCTNAGVTEADITLDYANSLKSKLEENGLKVKLTRTNSNTESYKEKATYDTNGRITVACESKAKYMISLHVNNGNKKFSGVEIYAPSKVKLNFAQNLVKTIVDKTTMEYSNVGKYEVADGVYIKNFSNQEIQTYANIAKTNGYENYNLNTETSLLYTIREVGGIATNAFVDGRNKKYNANKYYKSNQGIECYQLELGYIKNDLSKIQNEKEQYIEAISEAIIQELSQKY
ncbi:MAG: N-acetylmuramoyl-L-alanine amidase [Clostridia bacterium]|nr:N-acetylmuramoyl-L-alanine amidase [Clostridia bacterium]